MEYFVHANGLCESESIGKNTRIWAFAHVLPKARIGEDCNICDHVFIENDVSVGHRVTIKCGVQLWDGIEVGDDVFIGPNVTFTNDRFPRSKQYPEKFLRTIIMKGASIGANATLLPGISVGTNAMVGAGSVVTRAVLANAIVVGNPARIVGYVDAVEPGKVLAGTGHQRNQVVETEVPGVTMHFLSEVSDMRGSLSVGEFERYIPFTPLRYFLVYDVPTVETRGEHAHFKCKQFLVVVKGSVHVVTDDGHKRQEIVLDRPSTGLYLPPMTWGIQYRYSPDAVLLVFASDYYDSKDYIRNYADFFELTRQAGGILV